MNYLLFALAVLLACMPFPEAAGAQTANGLAANTATLRVDLKDGQNAGIEGATVTAINMAGGEFPLMDATGGNYIATGLPPGKYTLRVSAEGFASSDKLQVDVPGNGAKRVTVALRVKAQNQEIFVYSDPVPSPIPEFLGGVRIIRGKALENLPETDEAMMAYLRILAPRSTGPFGPTIIVDGFEGGKLPPKATIREIRINDNPYSSEFSQVGTNRVEILTQPGTENWQSGLFLNFNDESLNSRNPFADTRAPYQSRVYGGNLSGPLIPKRLTFFTNAERMEHDDNDLIRAVVVDSAFNIQPYNHTLIKPSRQTTISQSLNIQLTPRNTLALRAQGSGQRLFHDGIGGFSLESRGYESTTRNDTFQLTETAVLAHSGLNELRMQFIRDNVGHLGDDSTPTINVDQAFVGGGSEIGRASNRNDSWTIGDVLTWNHGKHLFKTGLQADYMALKSVSSTNFGGTYTFTGRLAPRLDSNNAPVFGPDGQLLFDTISNIESYRRTLLLQQQGLSPDIIRALGGGASQFSISAGSASATVHQYQLGVFFQYDWRLASKFTLNTGVRYDGQNNVVRRSNYAPRLGLAWQPISKTTLRLGSGLFYDNVGNQVVLQSQLFNGVIQSQYFAATPTVLDLFPQKVALSSLTSFIVPQAVWQPSNTLRMPYNLNSSFTVEQALPFKSNLAATATYVRGNHLLRSRNVNAALPDGTRPLGNIGEVFQVESSALSRLRQLGLNSTHNINNKIVLWTTYTLSNSKSDSDGPFTFPADGYNLRQEYSRSAATAKHTLYVGGWLGIRGGIELTPMIMWRSGLPYNITTGADSNGDSQFADRPGFVTDFSRQSVVATPLGVFDLSPQPGQTIIPRNFGTGPSFRVINLKMSKTIRLGEVKPGPYAKKRIMIWSVQFSNLFNQYNPGTPNGDLSAPSFAQSTSAAGDFGFGSNSAGNRRVEFTFIMAF